MPRDVSTYAQWFLSGAVFETVYEVSEGAAFVALHLDRSNQHAGVTARWAVSSGRGRPTAELALVSLATTEHRVLNCAPTGRLVVAGAKRSPPRAPTQTESGGR